MSPALAGGFSTTAPPGKPSRFLNDAFSERPSLTTSQKGVSYTAGEKVNGTSPYIAKLGFYILFDHLIPLLGMYLNICLHAYNDVFTR